MPSIVEITGKLSLDTSDFDSKLSGAASKVDQFTSSTGSQKIDLGGAAAASDLDQLNDSASRAASGVEELNNVARGEEIAAAAEQVSAYAASLGAFSDEAIAQASDLNEAQSAVNTVYGESADVINSFAADAAQNLGMTESQALSTSGQLGAMFSSMGLGTEETADMSTQLLQTAADLGSFHNAMPTEAMDALRSGLIGESEPLRRFGILLTEDAVKAKAMEEGIIAQGESMTEAQKVQARYLLIMDQIGAAQGDFARTSDGVANATRIQQAAMADLQAEIGQGLLPLQLQQMQTQAKLVGSISQLPPQLVQFGAMAAFAAGNAAPLIQGMSQIAIMAPSMVGGMKAAGGAVGEFANAGKLAGLAFSPLGIALAALAVGIVAYQTNFLGFADAIDAVVGHIKTFADYIRFAWEEGDELNDFLANLPGIVQPMALAFGTAVAAIREFVDTFTELFAGFQERGFDPITSGLAALNEMFPQLNGLLETAYDLWTNFGDAVAGVADGLHAAFDALMAGDIGGMMAGLGEAAAAGLGGFIDALGIIGGAVLQAFQAIDWDAVGQSVMEGLQSLSQWFFDAFNAVDWPGIASILTVNLDAIGATILTWGAGLTARFLEAFNQIDWAAVGATLFAGVQNAVLAIGDFSLFLLEKGAQLIAGLVQGVGDHLPDVTTKLGEISTNVAGLLPDALTLLLQKGADLIAGLVQGIGDHLPDVSTKLDETSASVADSLPDALTLLLGKGADIIAGLLQGITDKWPEVDAWLGNLASDVTETVGELASTLLPQGEALISGLLQGITDKWPEVDTWLAGLAADATETVGELGETLLAAGTALITGLSTGAQDFWTGTVQPWLGTLGQLATDATGELGETLLAAGQALLNGLYTGALEFWNNTAGPWLQSLPQLASDALGELGDIFLAKGQELMNGLYTGALDFWNNTLGPWIQSLPTLVSSAMGDLSVGVREKGAAIMQALYDGLVGGWGTIVSWVQNLSIPWPQFQGPSVPGFDPGAWAAGGRDAAGNLIGGLTGGLDAGAPLVENSAAGLGTAAVGAINDATLSESPSRATYQTGIWFDQGFANGVDDGIPFVEDSIRLMAGVALDGILAMTEPLTLAAATVTDSVVFEFETMGDDIRAIVDQMLVDAGVAARTASNISNSVSRDTRGDGGTTDTGTIKVRDKGGHTRGHNADASGGTFTHGDIDEGTNLDVDVSGGTAVDKSGKGGKGGRGGDVNINNVNVRDDRGLLRAAKDIQRKQEKSRSRGK